LTPALRTALGLPYLLRNACAIWLLPALLLQITSTLSGSSTSEQVLRPLFKIPDRLCPVLDLGVD
jgi:hypothetical protein